MSSFFITKIYLKTFTFQAFLAGALLNAVPGIALQLVLIPVIMVSLDKAGIKRFTVNTAQA